MEDYVEDYSYNKNFWMKSQILYSHFKNKFEEYLSIGEIINKISEFILEISEKIKKVKISEKLEQLEYENSRERDREKKRKKECYYKPLEKPDNSTRSMGIKILFAYIDQIVDGLNNLYIALNKISKCFEDRKINFEFVENYASECDVKQKEYQEEINKLQAKKDAYYNSIHKAIENYLTHKNKNKNKNKEKHKNEVNKKRDEYKEQVKIVEKMRVEYCDMQGHIFAYEDEFEKESTNDFKRYLIKIIEDIKIFQNSLTLDEKIYKKIEEIDGKKDNEIFSKENKSLMTGPKRNLFKEYSQDLNYYMENFDFLKKELKNKTPAEIREKQKYISQDIGKFLNEIIIEDRNDINENILNIAKNLKENKLTETEYNYLIDKFEKRFEQYLEWKKKNDVENQFYKKVGEDYDDRYCYMNTFLGYFNKTRVENKCLNRENFDYFCNAIIKILELNTNEDIDYSLCDLVVILSSTFYTTDNSKQSKKKYINEVIKACPIFQKQGFWIGLTRFELNQEIQQQKKEKETLDENGISLDKINNSVTAKLMSVTYNILQFVSDSLTFNKIVKDIFNFCKIDDENRNLIMAMMESQLTGGENGPEIVLDKDFLLDKK